MWSMIDVGLRRLPHVLGAELPPRLERHMGCVIGCDLDAEVEDY